jgi:hypothetical protein
LFVRVHKFFVAIAFYQRKGTFALVLCHYAASDPVGAPVLCINTIKRNIVYKSLERNIGL